MLFCTCSFLYEAVQAYLPIDIPTGIFTDISMQFLVVLALAIALVAVLFAIQNPIVVAVNFFLWTIQERLALVLLLTLAVGVLVGVLVSIPAILKRSMKISSHRRQLEDLKWQAQQKDEQLAVQNQEKATIFQQQRELLMALNTTDPTTGLLRGEFVIPALAYLLNRMAGNLNNPRYASIAVFRLETHLMDGNRDTEGFVDPGVMARSLQAIARRLERTAPVDSWLYYDPGYRDTTYSEATYSETTYRNTEYRGAASDAEYQRQVTNGQGTNRQGRFTCIVSGLDSKAASECGERLRSAVADQSLELDDGKKLPVTVSVGGVITLPTNYLDSQAILQQADAALEQAKRRGRNRFRLEEAKG